MAGGFFSPKIFGFDTSSSTMIGRVVVMIGLALCRIGVGMAGVVLSYRVTLIRLPQRLAVYDTSSLSNGGGFAGVGNTLI